MRTNEFDYRLPPELIAQTPLPRGESRLLVLHRETGEIEHRTFRDILSYLHFGDTLVLNDTRVSARRLHAIREGGESAELLLLRPVESRCWEALVKPGRALKPGKTVSIPSPEGEGESVMALVLRSTPEGGRILEFETEAIRDSLQNWGVPPLPPYIQTPLPADDEERYQTVYGVERGSAAAPTAGLHFTPEILAEIKNFGVEIAEITLHVGYGTFEPVRVADLSEHRVSAESGEISGEAANIINRAKAGNRRIIAVGTTTTRALESVADENAHIAAGAFTAYLTVTPGYKFKIINGLLTNFHLPQSSLLVLVSTFAGYDLTMRAYRHAVESGYRFYSYGDCVLITG